MRRLAVDARDVGLALLLLAGCLLGRHGWSCRYGADHERRTT